MVLQEDSIGLRRQYLQTSKVSNRSFIHESWKYKCSLINVLIWTRVCLPGMKAEMSHIIYIIILSDNYIVVSRKNLITG